MNMKETWNATLLRWTPLFVLVIAGLLVLMVGLEVRALLQPIPFDNPKQQVADLINKQLWMRATEITMGYVLGVLCVGVGVILTWNSVEAATKIEAGKGDVKFGLTTGSGGVIIVFVGAVLVAATLLSPRARIGPTSTSGGPESVNAPNTSTNAIPFLL
jgi:hypothetical protein